MLGYRDRRARRRSVTFSGTNARFMECVVPSSKVSSWVPQAISCSSRQARAWQFRSRRPGSLEIHLPVNVRCPFSWRPPIIENHFPSLAQSPAKTLPRQFARIANTPSYNPTKNGISVSAIEREKFRFREVDLRHEGCSKLRFCETPEVAKISTCMRTHTSQPMRRRGSGAMQDSLSAFLRFFWENRLLSA